MSWGGLRESYPINAFSVAPDVNRYTYVDVPKQLTDRRTARRVFRYRSSEMSGALPSVLFKYLALPHAHAMLDAGELMFSTLSWFQNLEDPDRGDGFEGTHKYFPIGGLEATRLARDGKAHAPVKMTLPSDSFQSKARRRDHIFVYSTSIERGLTQFNDPIVPNACVEIRDPEKFMARIKATLGRWSTVRAATLIHDQVRYWSPADPPGNVHALPDRLTMNKHERFRKQHEYRFAFGTKVDVFDFENVEYHLVREGDRQPRPTLSEGDHRMLVRVGSLAHCCRLV